MNPRPAVPRHDHHADGKASHARHGSMMVICCIPLPAIAIALAAAGVVSTGFLLLAAGCTVMMFLMMRMMMGGVDAAARRPDEHVDESLQ